jgi:hypothetical protein
MRQLSLTDHVALSILLTPILRFNTTDCAHPSRGKTTLFLLRSEVDGFLPFRSISRTATWQTPMSWRMSVLREQRPFANRMFWNISVRPSGSAIWPITGGRWFNPAPATVGTMYSRFRPALLSRFLCVSVLPAPQRQLRHLREFRKPAF